jgi:hypothetical protein
MFDNIAPSTQTKSSMADFLKKNSNYSPSKKINNDNQNNTNNINNTNNNSNNIKLIQNQNNNVNNNNIRSSAKISMNAFLSQNSNKEESKKAESPKKEKKIESQNIQSYEIIENSKNQYEEILQCKKLPLTDLGRNDNIKIEISSPKKIEGGLFSKAYITYLITTNPLKLSSRRRYSDFEWLRSLLINLYPTSIIPILPRKSSYSDRFNEVFLNKRIRALEKFMFFLITDPLIRNSKLLYEFLKVEKDDEFTAKKNNYSKLKPYSNLNDIPTLSGTLNLKFSKKDDNYINRIKDNANLHENLIKKIKISMNSLNEEIYNVCNRFDEISNYFTLLHQSSCKYSENNLLTVTYELLSKYMKDLGISLRKHNDYINIDLKEYFKFIRKEFMQFKNLENQFENQRNTFLKNDEKLKYRKEELFKKGDISKWELNPKENIDKDKLLNDKNYAFEKMLDKDSKQNVILKRNYGYYSVRLIEEYERLMKVMGEVMKENILSYCKKETACITDLQAGVGDIIMTFQIIDKK